MIFNKKLLVVDISNILYRTFYVHKNEDEDTIVALAHHAAIMSLNKMYKSHKPDKVILAFDRANWRVDYTKSNDCISGKLYKGQRRKDMTPSQKAKYEVFKANVKEFEVMIRAHSSIISMAGDGLEADDIMAGIVEMFAPTNEIVIVSSDQDLMQLLAYDSVTLINSADGKPRTLKDYDGDAEYFLFKKFFRGDTGDNVQSAYPGLRETKIKRAYTDPEFKVNLLEEKWIRPTDGKEMFVKSLFKENRLLMDLREQPDDIQHKIITTILSEMKKPGKYNHFKFLKFCGQHNLKNIVKQVEQFVPLLSS